MVDRPRRADSMAAHQLGLRRRLQRRPIFPHTPWPTSPATGYTSTLIGTPIARNITQSRQPHHGPLFGMAIATKNRGVTTKGNGLTTDQLRFLKTSLLRDHRRQLRPSKRHYKGESPASLRCHYVQTPTSYGHMKPSPPVLTTLECNGQVWRPRPGLGLRPAMLYANELVLLITDKNRSPLYQRLGCPLHNTHSPILTH